MEITPMTRKQKKEIAAKKREKFKSLALLIILKSIEEYQKEEDVNFRTAFNVIFKNIESMETTWIKEEPQNAHLIRSGVIAAKKEIDKMLQEI